MKREDIEKAAGETAERLANISYAGGGHIGQDDLERAFENGADWRINSVWHDASEKPKKNDVHIAVLNKYVIKTYFWCDFSGWEKYVRLDNIEKWAYIEDLLPAKEEN